MIENPLYDVARNTSLGSLFVGSGFAFCCIYGLCTLQGILAIMVCIMWGLVALYCLMRALYLHLLGFEKGRLFLKKLPIKKIQEEATRFYDEE